MVAAKTCHTSSNLVDVTTCREAVDSTFLIASVALGNTFLIASFLGNDCLGASALGNTVLAASVVGNTFLAASVVGNTFLVASPQTLFWTRSVFSVQCSLGSSQHFWTVAS